MYPYGKPGIKKEDEDEKRRKMLGQEVPEKLEFNQATKDALESTKKAYNRSTYEKLIDMFSRGKK